MAETFEDGLAAATPGDFDAARRILLSLAEQGQAAVQNNLGIVFEKGLGVGTPIDGAQMVPPPACWRHRSPVTDQYSPTLR